MTPQPDLSTWLSREQTCAQLGISSRSLDTLVADQKLHPRRNGRAYVFDPQEVAARQKPANGLVIPPSQIPQHAAQAPQRTTEIAGLPGISEALVKPLIAELLGMVAESAKPPTLWTDLDTAATETGLSRRFLRRLIAGESLTAVKDGRIKVRRADLQELDVSEHLVNLEPLKTKPRKRKGRK